MADEPNTENSTDDSDNGAQYSMVVAPVTPPPNPPHQVEEAERENNNSQLEHEPARWTDHIMAWATVVMAVATIFLGIIAYFQWKDSGKLTEAASKAATAADEFQQSAATIEGKITLAQQNMQTIADSSKKTINATRDSIRLDQRAWLSLQGIAGVPEINKPWTVQVYFIDTGKTVAKNVRLSCNITYGKNEESAPFHDIAFGQPTLYAPNNPSFCELHPISSSTVQQPVIDSLSRRDFTIFVFGKVVYDDIFGNRHWLKFCRVMHPDGKAWDECVLHRDDTGDGPLPK